MLVSGCKIGSRTLSIKALLSRIRLIHLGENTASYAAARLVMSRQVWVGLSVTVASRPIKVNSLAFVAPVAHPRRELTSPFLRMGACLAVIYRRLHKCLVPWEKLPEEEKEKDRDMMRGIPVILARAGYAIVKSNK